MSRHEELSIHRLVIPPSPTAAEGSIVVTSLTPVAVAATTVASQTLTIPGVVVGDSIHCIQNPITNACGIQDVVATAANTVSVRFINPTGGSLTPTAGVYRFLVIKSA
jgi:hypothetical protein